MRIVPFLGLAFAGLTPGVLLLSAHSSGWGTEGADLGHLHQEPDTVVVLSTRAGPLALTRQSTRDFLATLRMPATRFLNGVATFDHPPEANDRNTLVAQGLEVLDYIQKGAYFVRVAGGLDVNSLAAPSVTAMTILEPRQKILSAIREGALDRFAFPDSSGQTVNPVINPDGTLNLLVTFFQGISGDAEDAVLEGFTEERAAVGLALWRIRLDPGLVEPLAEQNSVRWIDVAYQPRERDLDEVRDVLKVDDVQTFLEAWSLDGPTGAGVQIALFDEGVDQIHDDFTSQLTGGGSQARIVYQDPLHAPSWHGTAVAGVIAGNGELSDGIDSEGSPNWANVNIPRRWKGMAPMAELLDTKYLAPCRVPVDSTGECPQTEQRNWTQLMFSVWSLTRDHGLDVGNHSYTMTFDGEYDEVTRYHESMVRGVTFFSGLGWATISPRLHVYSAGNHGWTAPYTYKQTGYFSLTNQMKNGLVVGNYWKPAQALSRHSSFGPAFDGRIKPDVMAPGWFVTTTGYCEAGDGNPLSVDDPLAPEHACGEPPNEIPIRRDFYLTSHGASLSAGAAAGVVALLLEEYAQTFGVDLDTDPPLPSTLRAALIHTAQDQKAGLLFTDPEGFEVHAMDGPDYATGWGLLDAAEAVRLIRSQRIREGSIQGDCSVEAHDFYWFGSGEVKLTLAWDDRPGSNFTGNSEPKLVNDLDLVLIDPDGVRHYPWRLNHENVLDAGTGVILADDQQSCGTQVEAVRHLMPSGNPDVAPDQITPFASADRGKDHLNNVEQAVAPGKSGFWRAEVSGFKIPWGPQPYSLVGMSQSGVIALDPHRICQDYPQFCLDAGVLQFCDRFPELCDQPPVVMPDERAPVPGPFIGSFRAREDRWIIPLSYLCHRSGHPCAAPGFEGDVNVAVEILQAAQDLRLGYAVFNLDGTLVTAGPLARPREVIHTRRPSGDGQILIIHPLQGFEGRREVRFSLEVY